MSKGAKCKLSTLSCTACLKCTKVHGPVHDEERKMEERERKSAALLMKDDIRPLTSYLLQGQWRRSGRGAALVYLAAHTALLLLILANGGAVHHG